MLVGPGHNGGDGLVVARELQLAGIAVRIWSPFERHKPLTDAHLRHARWLGIPVLAAHQSRPIQPSGSMPCLASARAAPLVQRSSSCWQQRQQQQPGQLIAIDGPTGLCADRGVLLGRTAACAALSLSIGLIKQGFLQDSALAWVGALERIELGLAPALLQPLPLDQPLGLSTSDLAAAPWPLLPAAAAKYSAAACW